MNSHHWPRCGVERGFTLVELVATMTIVGIIAAIAIPRFTGTQAFANRGYADELAAALRNGQKVAVSSGCWVSVTVNSVGYQALQRPDPADCSSLGSWSSPVVRSDGTLLAGSSAAGTTVVGNSQFIFTSAGSLQAAAASIQVGSYTVSVATASGLVTVN